MENQKKTGLGERIALLESDNSEPVRAGKDEMLRTLHSLAGAPLGRYTASASLTTHSQKTRGQRYSAISTVRASSRSIPATPKNA